MASFFAPSDLKSTAVVVRYLNVNQPAGAYDVMIASGDVLIEQVNIYVSAACNTFTSVKIENDNTPIQTVMTDQEGAVANLTDGNNVTIANWNKSYVMRGGKKFKYTITGAQGNGQLMMVVTYKPLVEGAILG